MYATQTKREEHLSSLKKTLKNNHIVDITPDTDWAAFSKNQILEQLEGLLPADKFKTLVENLS